MTGRDAAVCLFAALTVISAAGLAGALRSCMRDGEPGTAAVIVTGASLLCGFYAACGWGWYVYTAVFG